MSATRTSRQIRSLVNADGTLEMSIATTEVAAPRAHEVVVRVEASPINPSDLGLLFGGADMSRAMAVGTAGAPKITAPIAEAIMRGQAGRVGQSMAVGNEGGGVVVEAGGSDAAQALIGKTVGLQIGRASCRERVCLAV